MFEILPVQSWCRPSAHWKWAVEELVYVSHFPRLIPCPDLELHLCSHHGLVEHLSQSFSFAAWDCTGKGGNGGKWGRRDTGSLRNRPEELLLCWHCGCFWTATGEVWWALAGLSWRMELVCVTTGLQGAPRPGRSQGWLGSVWAHWGTTGQALVSCRSWQGLGEHSGFMAQEWELSSTCWSLRERRRRLQGGLMQSLPNTGPSTNTSEFESNWFQTNGQECLVVLLQFELGLEVVQVVLCEQRTVQTKFWLDWILR